LARNFRSARTSHGPPSPDHQANLGFITLTDAAPLFVAKEKGIRQIRHAGHRGGEAGLLGRDARQSRARLEATESTARNSHADAVPDLGRG
jgi:hypothetical protein